MLVESGAMFLARVSNLKGRLCFFPGKRPGRQPWLALIGGGHKDGYHFHNAGFDFCWLRHLLEEAGFVDVTTYPDMPHFISGVIDNFLASKPFDEFISLKVLAKRPSTY